MINTRAAMLTCDNKLTTALLFEKFGIPTPKTAFVSNENNIKTALDMVGGKFPVIYKDINRNTRRRRYQNRKLRRS
jgi:glutathione synthase/RimK-type ligase-like ATP-grasp enzyme